MTDRYDAGTGLNAILLRGGSLADLIENATPMDVPIDLSIPGQGMPPGAHYAIVGESRRFRFRDAAGNPPPLVPTPDAVKTWGPFWWRLVEPFDDVDREVFFIRVTADGGIIGFETGVHDSFLVTDDGLWSGPVLERPVKKEG